MMAMAMKAAPELPNICCITAVPTRSLVANLMPRAITVAPAGSPSKGRTFR